MRITCIAVGLLALGASSTVEAQPHPAPARPSPAAARRAAPLAKVFVSVNGGFQATANSFDDSETFREYGEDARYSADYEVKGGPTFDLAGGVRLWRNLHVAAGVTRFSRSTPVAVDGSIPHPFFFARSRAISGEISNVKREETAVHLQARLVVPLTPRWQAMVFGGPSFFQVKQGIVTGIRYSESYPFDSATFASADTTGAKESKAGVNVGGDLAFFFTRQLGVGFTAQFSGAELDVPAAAGGTQAVKAGGFQAGGGLRLRF